MLNNTNYKDNIVNIQILESYNSMSKNVLYNYIIIFLLFVLLAISIYIFIKCYSIFYKSFDDKITTKETNNKNKDMNVDKTKIVKDMAQTERSFIFSRNIYIAVIVLLSAILIAFNALIFLNNKIVDVASIFEENKQNILSEIETMNELIKNKKFMESNLELIKKTCEEFNGYLKDIINTYNSIILSFFTLDDSLNIDFPKDNFINVDSDFDILTYNNSILLDDITKIYNHIIEINKNSNIQLNTKYQYSFNTYIANINTYIQNKILILKEIAIYNPENKTLLDAIQEINKLTDFLYVINYNKTNNFDDLLNYIESMFVNITSKENLEIKKIIKDYQLYIGTNIKNISDLIYIATAIYNFIGPNMNFINIEISDLKQNFNTIELFNSYIDAKIFNVNLLQDEINNIVTGCKYFDIKSIDIASANKINLFMNELIRSFSILFGLSNVGINISNYGFIISCIEQINQLYINKKIILDNWKNYENLEDISNTFSKINNINTIMNNKFNSYLLKGSVNDFIECFDATNSLISYSNYFNLSKEYPILLYNNFFQYLKKIQDKYKSIISLYSVINNQTTSLKSLLDDSKILTQKIYSISIDPLISNVSKDNINTYLINFKNFIGDKIIEMNKEFDILEKQSLDFSNSKNYYTSINKYTYNKYIDNTINTKINNVLLDIINFKNEEDMKTFIELFKDKFILFSRIDPINYSVLPTININQMLDIYSNKLKIINNKITDINSFINENNIITTVYINKYDKISKSFIACCKTIPFLKIMLYLLIFSVDDKGNKLGILFNKNLNLKDIEIMLDNIPTSLLDPDESFQI